MKKTAFLIVLMSFLFAFLNVQAQDNEVVTYSAGDWDYIENNTGITLTAWRGSDVDLEIPSELDGKRVTQLVKDLFKNNHSLQSVFIPDGVTTIGTNAFNGCDSLKTVSLPDTLTKLDNGVFRYCISLETIRIPFTVTSIGSFTFADCISLKSITLISVTSIGESAFDNCQHLEEVTLSRKLTSVAGYAFRDTPWLEAQTDEFVIIGKGVLLRWNGTGTQTDVPYGVTMIADAFADSYFLETVVLPDTVVNIGQYAFRDALNLKSVTMPQYLTTIGANAFNGCRNLAAIDLPTTVKSLGVGAFQNCDSLTEFIIPPLVNSLPDALVGNCPALTNVVIPATVTKIDKNPFVNSPQVQFQVAAGSTAESYALEKNIPVSYTLRENSDFLYSVNENGAQIERYIGNKYDVEIPAAIDGEYVTAIAPGAFQNNPRVHRVIVPLTVKTIDDWAFSYMDSLEAVQLPAGLSSLGANAFTGSPKLQQIRIPNALESIGEKPISADAETLICATEDSYAAETLRSWGYTVLPESACEPDEETMALWAELNLLGVSDEAVSCECPPQSGEIEAVSAPQISAAPVSQSDFQIVEIPDGLTNVDNTLLNGTGSNLLLVIPASVTAINEEILEGRTLTIISESGTAAETFAREHELKFLVSFTTLLNVH